ncbi:MAG: hypothetical protein IKL52_06105 [Candidatus Gastranaerophilales bacterium]|nr:hypothetical protein [Candidatus Gastranaerophilales bacterium]
MQEQLNKNLKLTDVNQATIEENTSKYDLSKYKALDEFAWDDDLASKFYPIAQKLDLSQESVEILLDIALEMSRKQKAIYDKDEQTRYFDSVMNYNKLFNEDNELPKVNSSEMKKYLDVANCAYSDFASPKLKETLEKTGLVYHPEMIKMFHKIGELSQEDNLSHYGAPAIEELTPAQILYGTKQ